MSAAGARTTGARARARRRAQLLAVGAVVVALVAWLVVGGPWYLALLVGVLGAALLANVAALVTHRGPEDLALGPGRLREASAARELVSVPATWAPARRAPERARHEGRLQWLDGRLSFVVVDGARPAGRLPGWPSGPDGADLSGTSLLDVELWEVQLGPPPTALRPQLVLTAAGRTHVLDLAPGWDLTVGVTALVAREWWDQLHHLGAAAPDAER